MEALHRGSCQSSRSYPRAEAYLYFKNDIGGSAIGDATWLQVYVGTGR